MTSLELVPLFLAEFLVAPLLSCIRPDVLLVFPTPPDKTFPFSPSDRCGGGGGALQPPAREKNLLLFPKAGTGPLDDEGVESNLLPIELGGIHDGDVRGFECLESLGFAGTGTLSQPRKDERAKRSGSKDHYRHDYHATEIAPIPSRDACARESRYEGRGGNKHAPQQFPHGRIVAV